MLAAEIKSYNLINLICFQDSREEKNVQQAGQYYEHEANQEGEQERLSCGKFSHFIDIPKACVCSLSLFQCMIGSLRNAGVARFAGEIGEIAGKCVCVCMSPFL